jgi:hypothetical protein
VRRGEFEDSLKVLLAQSAHRSISFLRRYHGISRKDFAVADREYSSYQKKVIQRYYNNRPAMDEQRLAELATELYLASDKKKVKLWESAKEVMERLGTPASRIEHVIKTGDPALVAEVVKDVQAGKIRPKPVPKKDNSTQGE